MGELLDMQTVNRFPWQPLDYTQIPEQETCGLCNKPMYLLKVNPHVCFWVHRGEDIRKCKAPIAFKTSFTHGLKAFLEEKERELAKQIAKGKGNGTHNRE